jgi:hypothetical protein
MWWTSAARKTDDGERVALRRYRVRAIGQPVVQLKTRLLPGLDGSSKHGSRISLVCDRLLSMAPRLIVRVDVHRDDSREWTAHVHPGIPSWREIPTWLRANPTWFRLSQRLGA